MSEFVEFPKMARLTRECVITEKVDGTNAQIFITLPTVDVDPALVIAKNESGPHDPTSQHVMLAGSRTRYITPAADNFGFAKWVRDNAGWLFGLGQGRHFGEWWGAGIQRGYGLAEKRFSLFNTSRWVPVGAELGEKQEHPPECCHVVPVLYRGLFGPKHDENCIEKLRHEGSVAAPGFMKPEGIVVYHVAAGVMFKKTLEKDDQPKSKVA